MKTKLPFFLFFSLFTFCFMLVTAQPPAWEDYAQRRRLYPEDKYFTGFGESRVGKDENQDEKFKIAKSDAREAATQSIETTVQAKTYHAIEEMDLKIAEEFRHSVSTFSNVTVQGLTVETYYDKKTKSAKAFAWAKKSELAEICLKLYSHQSAQLDAKIREAKSFVFGGQGMKALDAYQECFLMVKEMEKNLVMVIICGGNISGKMPGDCQSEINTDIAAIEQEATSNPDELCQWLACSIRKQLGDNSRTIRLMPFTYKDTKMSSELSARLVVNLEQKLRDKGLSVSVLPPKTKDNDLLLTGVYWEEGDLLSVTAVVRDPGSGKTLASAVNNLPKSWVVNSGISFRPENLEDALIRQKVMTSGELIGGGLLLDIWTNKGNENLLFTEGEIMKLSVRANHECYLRFIYYFADSTKTLLEDGFYISSDQVNKVVTLPSDYKCLPPFGIEVLQVFAQNEPFKPLQLREENGYKIILGNTRSIVSISRAFQKRNDQQLFAEKRLIISTIK